MSEQTFTPPKYNDTTHILFNKVTGEIVATEKRWTLADDTTIKRGDASHLAETNVLKRLNKKNDLDILIVDSAEVKGQIKHIDIKSGKPVFEQVGHKPSTGISPWHIDAP